MFAASLLTALLAFPFSAIASDCARKYTVKDGDTCDNISASQNVSTYQLAVVNIDKINKACTNLVPGDAYCMGFAGSDCTSTYIVKSGDTCGDVATRHGLNTTILYLNNPQLHAECDNLYVGEVVCVGGSPAVPALPSGSPMPAANIPPGKLPAVPTPVATPNTTPTPPPPPPPSNLNATPPPAPSPTPAPTPAGPTDDDDCDDDDTSDVVDDEDLPFCDDDGSAPY